MIFWELCLNQNGESPDQHIPMHYNSANIESLLRILELKQDFFSGVSSELPPSLFSGLSPSSFFILGLETNIESLCLPPRAGLMIPPNLEPLFGDDIKNLVFPPPPDGLGLPIWRGRALKPSLLSYPCSSMLICDKFSLNLFLLQDLLNPNGFTEFTDHCSSISETFGFISRPFSWFLEFYTLFCLEKPIFLIGGSFLWGPGVIDRFMRGKAYPSF